MNAGKNIEIEAHEVAALPAHQAVEKYLEAAQLALLREAPLPSHYWVERGLGLQSQEELVRNLAFLNPDYTISRYPDAAHGIPYELYDWQTALAKVQAAGEVIARLRSRFRS